MLVRTYSKNTGVAANEVIEFLKTNQPDVAWSGGSKLNDDQINSLNHAFSINIPEQSQLPPAEEKPQLLPVQESIAITTESESTDLSVPLPEAAETIVADLALSLSRASNVEALIEGKLITHEKKISLLIQDSQMRLSNKLDAHFNFVETTVMNSIKQDLADINAHSPVQATKPKAKTSRDEMLELLNTAGLEIKS